MEEKDWKTVGELFVTAESAGLALYAFVTVPVTVAAPGERQNEAGDVHADLLAPSLAPAAHLVWAATPREARLMVCFPGGHFINELTGAALVSANSKDILDARSSQDIVMLAENLQAMLAQSALHD